MPYGGSDAASRKPEFGMETMPHTESESKTFILVFEDPFGRILEERREVPRCSVLCHGCQP